VCIRCARLRRQTRSRTIAISPRCKSGWDTPMSRRPASTIGARASPRTARRSGLNTEDCRRGAPGAQRRHEGFRAHWCGGVGSNHSWVVPTPVETASIPPQDHRLTARLPNPGPHETPASPRTRRSFHANLHRQVSLYCEAVMGAVAATTTREMRRALAWRNSNHKYDFVGQARQVLGIDLCRGGQANYNLLRNKP